jgi:hypothetical protein
LRLNLYNLANLTLTQLTKPEFTGEIWKKIKMAIRKQIDRLGKSFWYHGIHDFLKTEWACQLLKTKK